MMHTQTEQRSMAVVVEPGGVDPSRSDVSTERGIQCRYQPDTGCYCARFDDDSRQPSEVVVDVVAAVAATDPLDLPPLFHAVDPEALDAFVDSVPAANSATTTFEYSGCEVTVTA